MERQISDDTRLRRVVALFQRKLGQIFKNASVRRRNRRYEIDVGVYETPMPGGKGFRMSERQIREWIRVAAESAHPRLYKRMTVNISPWKMGKSSQKLLAAVKITIDAAQTPDTVG